jgi:hypothetical protein
MVKSLLSLNAGEELNTIQVCLNTSGKRDAAKIVKEAT